MIFLLLVSFTACGNSAEQSKAQEKLASADPVQAPKTDDGYKKAYFASGCFWCTEYVYESVKGVKNAISGYAGGTGKNPTYQNYGSKGHAEAVEVIYDPDVVDYETLLDVYFGSQNVTQKNGQGPDHGSSYRSIIFYQNAEQKKIAMAKKKETGKKYDDPVAAEIMPFQKFWEAVDYHQKYVVNHRNSGYVQGVSLPRFRDFAAKFPDLLKKKYQ
jgi:peptide-methionine (S)-S-oxide reductase